ncbi:hypothetical protein [Geodermatophilus sp. TF02-6]|uniref:hypothetical protein n=1 Tax=Geodermatophilus sp. TF02-6 TaxID=2250575 RepID=UPI0011BF2A73|nr:hypothetical protein [Geodermatophilus sp. TF02-6]
MHSPAPAVVPWVVLALALLALAGLAAAELTGRRRRPAAPPAPARPVPRFPHDDLPGFLDAPPGTPVPPAPVSAAAVTEDTARLDGSGRVVVGTAAAALVLVAALAGVAAGVRDDAPAPAPATAAPPAPPTGTATPSRPLPALPGVPADPLPGESGAGALADRSVPLGRDGVTARLSFGGIVVERHAVGTTVAYPSVSVTATGDGSTALAHVRLPGWNCTAAEPPEDPAAAGCVRSVPEYADLPSPALTVTRDGADLRLTGRFPTYTRPIGTAPAYTGRVYDLTVTVRPADPVREGAADAVGTLFLGDGRAAALDLPGLSVVRFAG